MRKIVFLVIVFFLLSGGLLLYMAIPDDLDVLHLSSNYVFNESEICINDSNGLRIVIPDNVINYMYDDDYIIAKQIPLFMRADYYWAFDSSSSKDSLNALKRKCYDMKECYWIISTCDNKIIGPLTESDFDAKCKEMKITIKMDKRYESQN